MLLSQEAGTATNDCVSGEAEPLLRRSGPGIKDYEYFRESARLATERITLADGKVITVTRSGCAHFVIAVRTRQVVSGDDGTALLAAARSLLERLIAADPQVLQLPRMLHVIRTAENPTAYRSGDLLTETPGYSWVTVTADDEFLSVVYNIAL